MTSLRPGLSFRATAQRRAPREAVRVDGPRAGWYGGPPEGGKLRTGTAREGGVGLTDEQVREKIKAARYWYHRIPIRPGIVTPGVNDAEQTLALLDPPADCTGLRVLDLGARDGFFAFEFWRRGADVLAVDYAAADRTGFAIAAELLGSQVTYLHENVYNLSAAWLGTFDVVLCLGLLYHLPDPIRA